MMQQPKRRINRARIERMQRQFNNGSTITVGPSLPSRKQLEALRQAILARFNVQYAFPAAQ